MLHLITVDRFSEMGLLGFERWIMGLMKFVLGSSPADGAGVQLCLWYGSRREAIEALYLFFLSARKREKNE